MIRVCLSMRMAEAEVYREMRDSISHDWIRYVEDLGLTPVIMPNCLKDPVSYFIKESCGALVLTNGEDIRLKKRSNNKFTGTERDLTEAELLTAAIKKDIPVIGVCRGSQFINKYFGGEITDVPGHVVKSHDLDIVSEKAASLLKASSIRTNSFHKHGVVLSGLASALTPWAVKDDVVEAFSHKDKNIHGIQWHPERPGSDGNIDKIFLSLALKKKWKI